MTPTPLDHAAMRLLLLGQTGHLLLCNRTRSDWRCDPLPASLEHWPEWDYFGIVPRQRSVLGTKASINEQVWSLWVDVDPTEHDTPESNGLTALQNLHASNLGPTFILHSGGGYWGHWKLSVPVTRATAERLNRRLCLLLGTGDACHNVDRTARLPGAKHQGTGVISSVVEMGGQIYDPTLLDRHLPVLTKSLTTPSEIVLVPLPDGKLTPMAETVVPGMLGFMLRNYISWRPTREQAKADGFDRSEVEWGITKDLLRYGLAPDDALSWFNHYALARHSEEYAKRKDCSWTVNLITKAMAVMEAGLSTSLGSPFVVGTLHQPLARKNARVDRFWLVRYVRDHQPIRYTPLVAAIEQRCDCSTRAAKNNISLGHELGIFKKTEDGYVLTPAGAAGVDHKGFITGDCRIADWRQFIGKQPRRSLRRQPAAD
jgi:hypothetical protein